MPDPFLAGNGAPCPTCAGTGRARNPAGRLARCPAGCRHGRQALTPEQIMLAQLVENRAAQARAAHSAAGSTSTGDLWAWAGNRR